MSPAEWDACLKRRWRRLVDAALNGDGTWKDVRKISRDLKSEALPASELTQRGGRIVLDVHSPFLELRRLASAQHCGGKTRARLREVALLVLARLEPDALPAMNAEVAAEVAARIGARMPPFRADIDG